jgi:CubicO group peptidase (beta-lactamase class C family)
VGRLYLNNGIWAGEQIVPAEWVELSTSFDTSNGSTWNYQYQWWQVTEGGSDFTALGHLGQFVYVNPDHDVIIVRLGTSRGAISWDGWTRTPSFIATNIAG